LPPPSLALRFSCFRHDGEVVSKLLIDLVLMKMVKLGCLFGVITVHGGCCGCWLWWLSDFCVGRRVEQIILRAVRSKDW
jgi:hypothetical protein